MTPLYAIKETPQIRYQPAYKQLELKTNRTLISYGNRNGHHNTEHKLKYTLSMIFYNATLIKYDHSQRIGMLGEGKSY